MLRPPRKNEDYFNMMDWNFVREWLEGISVTPEEVYLAVREYLLKRDYQSWRSTCEHQMEFNFG